MSSSGGTTKQSRRHTVHSVHSSSASASTSASTAASSDPSSAASGLVSFGHHGSHLPGTLHTSASASSLSSSTAGAASASMSPPQLQPTSASAPTSPTASKPRQTVISRFFKRVRFSFSGSGGGNQAQPQQQQQPAVPAQSLVDSIPAIPTSPSLSRSMAVPTAVPTTAMVSQPPVEKRKRRHTQPELVGVPPTPALPAPIHGPSASTRSPPRPTPAASASAQHFAKDATAASSPASSYATPTTSHLTLPQYVTAPSPLMGFDEFSPVPRAQLVGSLMANGDGESPEVRYASVSRGVRQDEQVDSRVPDSTSTEGINTSLASSSDAHHNDHQSFHTARLAPPPAPPTTHHPHVRSPTAPTFLRRPSTTASITSSILPRPASAGPPSAAADEQLIMLPTGLHRIISRLRRDETGVVVSVLPTPGSGGGPASASPSPSAIGGGAAGAYGGVAGNRQPSIASGGSGGSGGAVGTSGGGGGAVGVVAQGQGGAGAGQGPARLRQQFWMKDEACKECYDCKTPFSTFRRKHHCRICGQIFCYRCASNTIPGESLGYVGTIRVCDYCLNVMRSYSGNNTNAANMNASTTSIPNNANFYHRSSGLSSYYFDNYSPPASPRPPSMFGGYTGAGICGQMPPTPRGLGFPPSSSGRPRSLYWMEEHAAAAPFRGVSAGDDPTGVTAGVGAGAHVSGAGAGGVGRGLIMGLLGTPSGGAVGAGAAGGVDDVGAAAEEEEEEEEEEQYNTLTPQFLLQPAPPARHGGHGYSAGGGTSGTVSAGGSRPGTPTKEPDDGGSAAPGGGSAGAANGQHQHQQPQSAAAALAAAAVAQARKRTFIHRRRSLPSRVAAAQRTSVVAPDFWLEPVESSGSTRPLLDPVAADHMRKLVRQLVSRAKLQTAWEGVMYDLAVDVCGKVVAHGSMSNAAAVLGDMDVRHLIKFKKIPGGRPSDTQFLSGAVAKKTLAHRKMASVIESPRIVILGFPLEYHRVQDQLMSLDPVRAQERDHLKILCDRVLTLDPQVVLVERTVARLALEYLYEHGVAVAYNIKRSVLENIARFTGADVIQSIDKLAAQNRAGVGTCGTFSIRMYAHGAAGGLPPKEVVPLMVFDACPSELGGCVVLRGEEREVLRKVKEVLRFVLFAFAALRRESVMLQTLGSSLAPLSGGPVGGARDGVVGFGPTLARVGSTLGSEVSASSEDGTEQVTKADKVAGECAKDPPVYDDDLLNKLLTPYRAILSTSPGIIFPAPYLIERYRREVVHRKSKTHDLSRLVGASPTPGSASFSGSSAASASGSSNSKSNGSSGGSVAAAPSPMLGMSASGIERVSRDALNYILESQQVISPIAHQSIIFLSCTITDVVKCVVPHLQFIEYYGADDVTLAGYIEHVVETAASLCHQCHLPFTRHRRVYYHGNRAVTVTVHEDPSVMSDTASIASAPVMTTNWRNHLVAGLQQQVAAQHPASTTNAGSMSGDAIPMGHAHLRPPSVASATATANGGGGTATNGAVIDLTQVLRVQTVCHICDAVTTPKPVPLEAAAHSFAKYLELAFYSGSARSETCQHSTFTDHRHIYLLSGYAVHIDVQPIRLLEVSFPSMRVVLDGVQALLGKEQARARVVALIESVFLSVEKSISQHLHQLSTSIAAAAGGQPVVVTAVAASSGHASGVSSPIGWATGGPSTSAPAASTSSAAAAAAVNGGSVGPASTTLPAGSNNNNNNTATTPLSTSLAVTPSSFLPSASSTATVATIPTNATSTAASTLITNHAIAVDETEFRDLMLVALQEKQELLDMCTEVFERTPVHDVLCFNTVIEVLLNRSATWVEHLAKLKQHMAAVTSQVTADSKAAAAAAAANAGMASNGAGVVGANGLTVATSQNGSSGNGASGAGSGAGGSAGDSNAGAPGGVAGFISGGGGADAGGSSLAGGTGWILRALQEMSTEVKRTAMAKLDLPTPSTSPINKPLHVAMEAAIDAEEYLGSPAASRPTPIMMPSLDRVMDDDMAAARPASIRAGSGNEKTDGKKTSGIVQSLVNLLTSGSSQASSLSPLTAILSPTEHFVQGNPVILREDEPTSIVAFAHKTGTYCRQLEALQRKENASETPTADIGVSPFREIQVQEPDGDVDEEQIAETWLEHDPGSSGHIDVEQTEGPLRLGCRTYFAAEFHQLRQNCQVDPYFVHSMSRCHVWDASGGKSGSTFLKTRDDRFVIKQVSKMELELFSRFAPSYFAYMNKTIFSQIPTILAKIFGVYRVATKNTVTGKSMKLDFMVMENLWYNKNITKMFDLKGSTRNRHISTTAQQAVARTPASIAGSLAGTLATVPMTASSPALSIASVLPPTSNPTPGGPSPADRIQVLLDGNFIEQTHMAPLFVREYSRKVLATSIYNDTLFLSRLNIMDYSLVVGIDETNQELVVGIIDFIRTYTWDKKLETWVKETGLLGGGEPTIVSPKQYKTRFRDAMDRYFLMVPDKFCTAKSGALGHTLLL